MEGVSNLLLELHKSPLSSESLVTCLTPLKNSLNSYKDTLEYLDLASTKVKDYNSLENALLATLKKLRNLLSCQKLYASIESFPVTIKASLYLPTRDFDTSSISMCNGIDVRLNQLIAQNSTCYSIHLIRSGVANKPIAKGKCVYECHLPSSPIISPEIHGLKYFFLDIPGASVPSANGETRYLFPPQILRLEFPCLEGDTADPVMCKQTAHSKRYNIQTLFCKRDSLLSLSAKNGMISYLSDLVSVAWCNNYCLKHLKLDISIEPIHFIQ
jgi:hypothetical protein